MDKSTNELIGAIRSTQGQLTGLLESISFDQDWQPAPKEWSFRFIAAHLATTEKECYQDRVVRMPDHDQEHIRDLEKMLSKYRSKVH
jgi:hypothetical protein